MMNGFSGGYGQPQMAYGLPPGYGAFPGQPVMHPGFGAPAPQMAPQVAMPGPVDYSYNPVPPMQGLDQPPPVIAFDPNEFRNFYRFGLQQLHFNNKLVINDLTTLAKEFQHRMSVVVSKEIELHIKNVHPSFKLTAFYVLDSICKNVGHPYPALFRPWIEHAFLTAIRQIEELDPPSLVKYHELLGTWRTSGPHRSGLFGDDVQKRLEAGVFGHWRTDGDSAQNQAFQSGVNQQPAAASSMEKSSVLFEIRKIRGVRERLAAQNPGDQLNLAQITTLTQLEQVVANQQLSLIQIDDIRQQLQNIRPPSPLAPPAISLPDVAAPEINVMDPRTIEQISQAIQTDPRVKDAMRTLWEKQEPGSPLLENEAFRSAIASDLAGPESAQAAASALAGQPALLPAAFDPAQLAAVANALAGLKGEGSSAVATPNRLPSAEPSAVELDDPFITEYEEMAATFDVEMSTSALLKPRADLCDILYDRIPKFIRQDGARFLNGPVGNKRAAAHLDANFRYHRRLREGAGRLQQRVWATLEVDWIVSKDFGDGDDAGGDGGKGKAKEAIAEAKPVVDPRTKTVPRPADPVEAAKPCPVCKEAFETSFDDEEDDFLFVNAVKIDGVIYHATCRAETLARSKGAAKLKAEETGTHPGSRASSREPTPVGAGGKAQQPLREKVLGKRKSPTPDRSSDAGKRVKPEPTE